MVVCLICIVVIVMKDRNYFFKGASHQFYMSINLPEAVLLTNTVVI